MPFDGHSYLVSQGWSGKGTGLRTGAISRPLAIPQKRTLAGLGKDRDEAFPFWDHLFDAAAKAIQVKISEDSEGTDDTGSDNPTAFQRTSTGILSNRRPVSGSAKGLSSATHDSELPLERKSSLIAIAKREAAKRGLYSRFFRGPLLCPDDIVETKQGDRNEEKVRLVDNHGTGALGVSGSKRKSHHTVDTQTDKSSTRKPKVSRDELTEPGSGENEESCRNVIEVTGCDASSEPTKERKRRKRNRVCPRGGVEIADEIHQEYWIDGQQPQRNEGRGRHRRHKPSADAKLEISRSPKIERNANSKDASTGTVVRSKSSKKDEYGRKVKRKKKSRDERHLDIVMAEIQ